MRVGIDFGTTRTVVAVADRGNYPTVTFDDPQGDTHDYLPSVVALASEEAGAAILCGHAAVGPEVRGPVLRSIKRLLSRPDVSATTPVAFGSQTRPLGVVLRAFAAEVVRGLREGFAAPEEPIEAILGVPANASSTQRLLTMEAFAAEGVTILGVINEPSAAAFEYTHRHARTLNSKRTAIIVYDLGGGTFDTTYLSIDGPRHTVLSTRGIADLGGDDFDEALLRVARSAIGNGDDAGGEDARGEDALGSAARARLLDEARSAKESLRPQTRRFVLDLADEVAVVPVDAFYAEIEPLVARTIGCVQDLIGEASVDAQVETSDIAGVYVVGGATSVPSVARELKRSFGRRVHRSPLPTASTAVGLAIAADPETGFHVDDQGTYGVGVFREWESGRSVSFDPLLPPGSATGQEITRTYRAAHNIGWYRFVEYARLDAFGAPGDLRVLADIRVPFDRGLIGADVDLSTIEVDRLPGEGPLVEETISIGADGIARIRVAIPEWSWSVAYPPEG